MGIRVFGGELQEDMGFYPFNFLSYPVSLSLKIAYIFYLSFASTLFNLQSSFPLSLHEILLTSTSGAFVDNYFFYFSCSVYSASLTYSPLPTPLPLSVCLRSDTVLNCLSQVDRRIEGTGCIDFIFTSAVCAFDITAWLQLISF